MKITNYEQSTSSIVTVMSENTHELTYSVARVIEVTAWQSVDAVYHCCLTHGSCHWPGLRSLLAIAMGASSITSPKNGWSAFICPNHLHMTCSACWTSLCAAYFI